MEQDKKLREDGKASKLEELADNQQIYDDTMAQKKADTAFFDQTKTACLNKHDAWTRRSSLRDEEIEGVAEALAILSTDSARELFHSAIKDGKETHADDSYDTGKDITSFLQMRKSAASETQLMGAYAALKKQATSAH